MFIHNFRLCCTSEQPIEITFCFFHLALHLQIEGQNSSPSIIFNWKHCLIQKQLDWGKIYFLSHFLSSRFTNKVATKPQNCPVLEGLKWPQWPQGSCSVSLKLLDLRKPNLFQFFPNTFYSLILALKSRLSLIFNF